MFPLDGRVDAVYRNNEHSLEESHGILQAVHVKARFLLLILEVYSCVLTAK